MGVVSSIVSELAANVSAVTGPSDYEIAVYAGMLFNPSTTAIDIYPADPFRDEESAGMGTISGAYQFVVRARTGLNDLDSGQMILLDLMDDDSEVCLAHALGDDTSLNGLASFVDVQPPSGFRPFRDLGGEGTMAGVVWQVSVLAAES